jgi:acetyl esterase/lipase
MALSLDPEVMAAMAPLAAAAEGVTPTPPGDVATRRSTTEALFGLITATIPAADDVEVTSYTIAVDGGEIEVRGYAKSGEQPGSAVVYLHGGGMILGSLDLYDAIIKAYVADTGVPLFAPEYRLAPEYPDPAPVEDCYAALVWLAGKAAEFGIDPGRIAVAGDSAGGGLAAGVALLARDRSGPKLAKQILIYPMLDDRTTTPDEQIAPFAVWTYDDNVTGWGALLGDKAGGDDVSIYAAPARAESLADLPPTFIDVGDLDVFRDEDIVYARRLSAAGVPVEFHLYPGCPHGFEGFARNSGVAQRAIAQRLRAVSTL